MDTVSVVIDKYEIERTTRLYRCRSWDMNEKEWYPLSSYNLEAYSIMEITSIKYICIEGELSQQNLLLKALLALLSSPRSIFFLTYRFVSMMVSVSIVI